MKSKNVQINEHFLDYIGDWEHYEYILVGGYGSSKSFNTAIKLIIKAYQEERKILVIRQTFATHRDSTFEDLKFAIEYLGLQEHFEIRLSPLRIKCKLNDSIFIFRGLDDVNKIKSIKDISIIHIEEGEGSYDDYKELKDRLRKADVKPHIIITCNPVSKNSWVYRRFFYDEEYKEIIQDEEEFYRKKIISKNNVYYHHSVYSDNVFLNSTWINNLLSEKNERLRKIKVEGRFGTTGIRVFENVESIPHEEIIQKITWNKYTGLDFGFAVSYNSLVQCSINFDKKELYIYEEMYNKNKTNPQLMEALKPWKDNVIFADREPKTITEMNSNGFRIIGADKPAGSVKEGLKKLQSFDKIYISDNCKNTYRDFTELEYFKEKDGSINEDKFTIDPHAVDATRYALVEVRSLDEELKKYKVYR